MNAPVPRVRVVREGFVVREGERIVDASSSVTLVESRGIVLIVDTASPKDEDLLLRSLKNLGMDPGRVDFVVNTHMHIDHVGCNDLFNNARVCAHAAENPPAGAFRITEDHEIAPGALVSPTPGHTPGCISVFVGAERKYAICGDAIPTKANYDSRVPPAIHSDRRLAVMSMDRILSWADIVVPGHGPPFAVIRKK